MHDYTFFLLMIGLLALLLIATAVVVIRRLLAKESGEVGGWELRGASGRIRAVARNTLAEGMRTKIAGGFAVAILISIPAFWFMATGDGTIRGRIQMFIYYSLAFSTFILSLLTIFFSCRSLSVEVSTRQIYGVATKPIPRWQVVAGKWCGVMLLNVTLVTVACAATYGGAMAIVWQFKHQLARSLNTNGGLTPSQAEAAIAALDDVRGAGAEGVDSPVIPVLAGALGWSNEQVIDMLLRLPEEDRVNLRRYDELRRRVLIARAMVAPEMPDFTDQVNRIYDQFKEQDRLPTGMSATEIRRQIQAELETNERTIPYGQHRVWRLQGPAPEKGRDFLMSVRFKINSTKFMDGLPELGLSEGTMAVRWAVGASDSGRFYTMPRMDPVDTYNEFEIPTEAVQSDGVVELGFENLDPRRATAAFELPWGLQILYRVGSFEENVVQTWLAVMVPLACLTAFGVCASTFLSFPVASLIVITLFIISSTTGFIADALATTEEYIDPNNITLALQIRQVIVQSIDWTLAIGDIDPVADLIEGRAIGWQRLWTIAWRFFLLKCMAVLFLGVLIFRRRELAAVIV